MAHLISVLIIRCVLFILLILNLSLHPSYAADDDFNLDALYANLNENTAALPFKAELKLNGETISFSLTPLQHSYIYKDSIKADISAGQIALQPLPPGEMRTDAQGRHEVYLKPITGRIEVYAPKDAKLTLTYQGCSTDGICYPPQQVSLKLPQAVKPQSAALENQLSLQLWQALAMCFGLGILMNFSPCVLPLLPVYAAIITGGTQAWPRRLKLYAGFASGMALTFMLLGLAFTLIGMPLHALLQSKVMSLIFSALLLLTAALALGLFNFTLPSKVNLYIQNTVSALRRGSLIYALSAGAAAAVLTTPCTSAPLAGIMVFAARSSDLISAAAAFFILGLGMASVPCLIGALGIKRLPGAHLIAPLLKYVIAALLAFAAVMISAHLFGSYANLSLKLSALILAALLLTVILRHFHCVKSACLPLPAALIAVAILIATQPARAPELFEPLTTLQQWRQLPAQPRLIKFGANWCTNCRIMDEQVFSRLDFAKQTQGLQNLKVDLSAPDTKDNAALIEHFAVVGVPLLILSDAQGRERARLTGYHNAAEVETWLKQHR